MHGKNFIHTNTLLDISLRGLLTQGINQPQVGGLQMNQSSSFNGPSAFNSLNMGPKPSEHQSHPQGIPMQQLPSYNAANSQNFAQRQFQRNQTPPNMLQSMGINNANARFPPQQCGPNGNIGIPPFYRPVMQQNVSRSGRFHSRDSNVFH